MAAPSNTLSEMLSAHLSICQACLSAPVLVNLKGSMCAGQQEEGNVTVFFFKNSNFLVELGLVKLFSFSPDCRYPPRIVPLS